MTDIELRREHELRVALRIAREKLGRPPDRLEARELAALERLLVLAEMASEATSKG